MYYSVSNHCKFSSIVPLIIRLRTELSKVFDSYVLQFVLKRLGIYYYYHHHYYYTATTTAAATYATTTRTTTATDIATTISTALTGFKSVSERSWDNDGP